MINNLLTFDRPHAARHDPPLYLKKDKTKKKTIPSPFHSIGVSEILYWTTVNSL